MKHQAFNSFWQGNSLSPLEWACLSSFVDCGHKFRLFSYESLPVPRGVTLEDASTVVRREDLFLLNGTASAFSNIFRYKFILQYGEWWVDTDVYCLKEDIPDCRYAWANEDADKINGAILKFPANDPTLLEITAAANVIGRQTIGWGQLGPNLLTEHLGAREFTNHLGQRQDFYPIHWLETFLLWLPNHNEILWRRCKGAYFMHLWTSIFSQVGIDRSTKPPNGSFLHSLYRPHLWRFSLVDLDCKRYNHTIHLMKAYLAQKFVVRVSDAKIGYDISKFPLDDYIFGRVRFWWEENMTLI